MQLIRGLNDLNHEMIKWRVEFRAQFPVKLTFSVKIQLFMVVKKRNCKKSIIPEMLCLNITYSFL